MAVCELVIEGEQGFRLSVAVSGYEFPHDTRGPDAEWLIATLELRIDHRVAGKIESDPMLRGVELDCFAQELEALLAGTEQAAELVTLEDMVELRLERSEGSVLASGTVTNHGDLEIEFRRVQVELTALRRTGEQLAGLLREFPVRG